MILTTIDETLKPVMFGDEDVDDAGVAEEEEKELGLEDDETGKDDETEEGGDEEKELENEDEDDIEEE